MTSTRDLSELPPTANLRRILQSLAMLDAILEEDWENRYYSFNARWSSTEQMGSMRNGSGDDFFAHFDSSGCFLRGFDHEAAMSPWAGTSSGIWPGVLEEVPPEFASSLREPAFHMKDTTFCIWRRTNDVAWAHGPIRFPDVPDPDGSEWMLALLDGDPHSYRAYANDYFDLDVSLAAISRVFSHEPLSSDLFGSFPTSRHFAELVCDAEEIGYPVNPRCHP